MGARRAARRAPRSGSSSATRGGIAHLQAEVLGELERLFQPSQQGDGILQRV
jgi:hypothetical protein